MKYLTTIMTLHLLTISFYSFGQIAIFDEYRFILDSSGYHGKTIPDTIYFYSLKIKGTGNAAVEKNLGRTRMKVGLWTEYYENGQIKSQGNYQIDSYIQCCSDGACKKFENYKTGEWKYFYDNGHIKATGNYKAKKEHIQTSCKGGDFVFTSHIDKTWKYYNDKGEEIIITNKTLKELETNINQY